MESRIVNVMSHKQRNVGTYFFCSRSGSILTFTKKFAQTVLSVPEQPMPESVMIHCIDSFGFERYELFLPALTRFLLSVMILQDRYEVGRPFVPVLDRNFLNGFPLNTGICVTAFWENDKWNLDAVNFAVLDEFDRPMRIFSPWIPTC